MGREQGWESHSVLGSRDKEVLLLAAGGSCVWWLGGDLLVPRVPQQEWDGGWSTPECGSPRHYCE